VLLLYLPRNTQKSVTTEFINRGTCYKFQHIVPGLIRFRNLHQINFISLLVETANKTEASYYKIIHKVQL